MASSDRELSIQQGIAERLVFFRTIRGLSQAAIGAECGCASQQIQKYESGKNRIPSCRLKLIADFLNVPTSAFYDEPLTTPMPRVSRKHLMLAHALVVIEARVAPKHRTLCNLIFAIAEADFLAIDDVKMEA